jgi:hypothetical protein
MDTRAFRELGQQGCKPSTNKHNHATGNGKTSPHSGVARWNATRRRCGWMMWNHELVKHLCPFQYSMSAIDNNNNHFN